MVCVFLSGPGGSGKTTLANELKKRNVFKQYKHISEVARRIIHKKGLKKDDLEGFDTKHFLQFQGDVLSEQCLTEKEMFMSRGIISDRSIMDCLAYSLWKTEKEFGCQKLEEFLKKHQVLINEAVKRYHGSLLVVVHSWSESETTDDGIRLSMSGDDCKRFTEILHYLLRRFKIGYLDLSEVELNDRVHEIEAAIKGEIKRTNFKLEYYMELSAKNGKKQRDGRHKMSTSSCHRSDDESLNDQTNFSFFLDKRIDGDSPIPSVKLYEDYYQLSFTELGRKRGRIFRDIKPENLFCMEFDMKVRATDVQKMLLGKIFVNGEQFNFLGCSSAGIKCRKAFLLKGTSDDVHKKLLACGEFQEIKSVSKRTARISLLFSSVELTEVEVEEKNILLTEDILSQNEKYNFSDGCGGISFKLAENVYSKVEDKTKIEGINPYFPSVYQLRLQGFKGVVALDPQLESTKLMIRPSMVKFNTKAFPKIGLCGFSKPYVFGHLNRQLIYLLSSLGVNTKGFLDMQREYFDLISSMHSNAEAAITMLHCNNRFHCAELVMRLTMQGQNDLHNSLGKHQNDIKNVLDEIQRSFLDKDEKIKKDGKRKEKLRVLVKNSRFVYGVCDQVEKLKYGQCYLRLTINGVPQTICGNIATGRMPCYLLGDIRVLQAVDIPELTHLVDCIVFPTQGKRPHADEQAGGDLDGDQFFVTWDERLIPPKTVPSHEYPAAETKYTGEITREKMIKYFSIQNAATKVTGLLANLYDKWADVNGPKSEECERIGQLFGRAIDVTKTGEKLEVPESLRKLPDTENSELRFVWQIMEYKSKIFKAQLLSKDMKMLRESEKLCAHNITEEYVAAVLNDEFTNLGEYQKFNFLWKYALNKFQDEQKAMEYINKGFIEKINFSLFTSFEKSSAIEVGVSPSLVENALHKAKILNSEDLQNFKMLGRNSAWGLLYRGCHSEFDMATVIKAVTNYDRTLICIKLPDDVNISLQFHEKLQIGEGRKTVGNVRALFNSKMFGLQRMLSCRELYYDLVDNRLQLYRNGNKNQSFVSWKSQLGAWNNTGKLIIDYMEQSNVVEDIISVDLTSFERNIFRGNKPHPLIRKTPFTKIEIFAMKENSIVYPDVLISNELDDIYEEEERDDEEEEEIETRDVSAILLQKLSSIPETEMPVCKLKEILDDLVSACVPWNEKPLEDVVSVMEEFLATQNVSEATWTDRILIMVSLCRLRQQHLAKQLMTDDVTVSLPDVLETLSDWIICWFIPPNILVPVVNGIIRKIHCDTACSEKEKYIARIVWSSFIELINDFTTCKQDISSGAICNLKIDHKLEVREEENDPVFTMYRCNSLQSFSRCPTAGEYVVVVRERDWKKEISSVVCIASVIHVTPTPLTIKLKVLDKDLPEVVRQEIKEGSSRWMINCLKDANVTLYIRIMKACTKIMKITTCNDLFNTIMNVESTENQQKAKRESISVPKETSYNELNIAQRESVDAAMVNSLTLIQGPPGTGKTKVACVILQAATKLFRNNILAVAETNTAVDNLTRRLLSMGVSIVRVGNIKYVPGDLYNTTLEGQLQIIEEKEVKKVKYQSKSGRTVPNKKLVDEILDKAEIILTTCAGAGDVVLSKRTFLFVLVDEATQTKEPTLLCSLAHEAEQMVLIGDPKQLGPLVKMEQKWNWLSEQDWDIVVGSLENTLFHKLYSNGKIRLHFLDTQYRMHPDIAAFPSEQFYEGRLKSDITTRQRQKLWSLTDKPMIFFNINGKEIKIGTSFGNEDEVKAVGKVVKVLLGESDASVRKEDIAVLALYSGQVRRLREILHNIDISTIDGFQGKEADVILVSTVRSRGNLGYSNDRRRLNVLLTRAKRGLVVIGHRETLESSPLWKGWIGSACVMDMTSVDKKISVREKK